MAMRSVIPGLVMCSWFAMGVPLRAQGSPVPTQPADLPRPVQVKRFTNWGYVYSHYRHHAGSYFRGPNVDQGFYEFLIRLPLFRSSVKRSSKRPMVIALHSRNGDFNRHERRWPDHVVLLPDDNTTGVGHSGWFGYHELAPERPRRDTVVVPYTERRLIYYIRFAVAEFGVDPHRIWVTGGSMGGGGALLFALHHPEWVAGAVAEKPPVDMRALPMLLPMAQKAFGPIKFELKVAGTGISVWQYTSLAWLLSSRPSRRTWLSLRHGRLDRVVPFEQYFTSVSPPGQSFLQLFKHGAVPGTFVWDMGDHRRADPIGAWEASFNPLAKGLVRTDRPSFAFSNPSLGYLGVPKQLGAWRDRQLPGRDPRGTINGFCRWGAEDLVDRPDRLEVSLWLANDGTEDQRCPVASMTYSVSPRDPQQFPIPPGCVFRYRAISGGPSGRATADQNGLLTLDGIPLRRGRDRAVKLQIAHAMPVPVVSLSSPTHPTRVPQPARTVVARWTVANDSPGNPMPVDRYRCWIAPEAYTDPSPDSETPRTERVFESLKPGRYHVMVQARLVTGRWGPVTARQVNVVPAWQ